MKKLIAIVFICIFFLSATGCRSRQYFSENLVSGTKWESEDPVIWFEVHEDRQCIGEIIIGDDVLPIKILLRQPHVFQICEKREDNLVERYASCFLRKHKDNWFTVEVSTNNIPDSKAKKITFKRVTTE